MTTAGSSRSNIELIVGPYRSGKSDRLLNDLIEFSRSNRFPNSMLVVPSARYRNLVNGKLKALLSARQSAGQPVAGIFGLQILTFYEACKLVLQTCGAGYRLLPDKMRTAVVGKVIEDLLAEGNLVALPSIARLPGTHAAVAQLIDELERAALSPAGVVAAVKQTAAADSRYLELARIYEYYWRELDRSGYTDEKRLAFTARELLFSQRQEDLHFGWLGVDGFDRLSPLQSQVIKGLGNVSSRVVISFDYIPAEPVEEEYQWKVSSYNQLVDELWAGTLTVVSPPARRLPPQRQVFSTLDRFLEMDEIARQCKRLLCEGCPAENILVVARDLQPYRGAVDTAFSSAGIRYFVDESVNLRDLPVVQFVFRLLRLPLQNFSREDVIACLRSPFCQLSALGLNGSLVDQIDRVSWNSFVVGGLADWEGCLAELDRAGLGLKKLLEHATPRALENSLTGFCTEVEDLLASMVHWEEDRKSSDGDFDPLLALSEIRRALSVLIQQELVLGEKPASYETFLKLLDGLLETGNYRRRDVSDGAVTICGAELAPNRSFDYMFIAGMVEGEFPRRGRSSGFVSSDEVARWAGFGIDISNPRNHPGFEPALFQSLIHRARKVVSLSYPRYEMNGEEVVPSFLVTEGRSEVEASIPYRAPYSNCHQPVSAWDAVSGCLWNMPGALQPPLESPDVVESWNRILPPLTVARQRLEQDRENLGNGYLSDLVGTGALKVELPASFSISSLNEYGKCPFRYWARKVLHLNPRPEHETGLDVKLIGDTYHKALELFYRKLSATQATLGDISAQQAGTRLEEAITQAFNWLEEQTQFHAGEFWQYEKVEMTFRLKRFLQFEIERVQADQFGFQPHMFEVRFGGKDGDVAPPLVVESEFGPVEINGIIDRIDVARNGSTTLVRVVDYKTGSASISPAEARKGRNMQLPAYALAVQRSVIPGSQVLDGVYLSVNSGRPIGKIEFSQESMSDILPLTAKRIGQFVSGMSRGVFTVKPNGDKVCESCDYRMVCRIAELPREMSIEEADFEHSD